MWEFKYPGLEEKEQEVTVLHKKACTLKKLKRHNFNHIFSIHNWKQIPKWQYIPKVWEAMWGQGLIQDLNFGSTRYWPGSPIIKLSYCFISAPTMVGGKKNHWFLDALKYLISEFTLLEKTLILHWNLSAYSEH